MDESPHGDSDGGPGATDADVEAAVTGVEGETGQRRADDAPADDPEDLPDGVLNAPTSAEEAGHTLLEDHERETRSPWRNRLRLGAFWAGATTVALAVTLTAIVSLRRSGFSDGLAFVLGSVGMAVVVGFVFLSVRR
ncbi:hypothetical protein DP107_05785 [Haloglomus irregulare]|jgi:hypothetical protein|uniref:Uncharacterized protein n=1 Tax=Haloglomus irregulare TaxID=2234134 RepID=A0A554NDA2_9EURY|nr:hypothetical protein [Haloglomus irregulare]TSD15353.1 hypothetical protein DP107_05785 [Haloglomus irregulare]